MNDIVVDATAVSSPHPARPDQRAAWAVATSAVVPGANTVVLAGAEEGGFALLVALARRRPLAEAEQLLGRPLGVREGAARVRGLLAEPLTAPLRPPAWGGGEERGGGGEGSAAGGEGGVGEGKGTVNTTELPPVPQMQVSVRGWLMMASFATGRYRVGDMPTSFRTQSKNPNAPPPGHRLDPRTPDGPPHLAPRPPPQLARPPTPRPRVLPAVRRAHPQVGVPGDGDAHHDPPPGAR